MERGSATRDDRFAYFAPWGSTFVYRYEWKKEKWEQLPQSPHRISGLVIIDGALTAVTVGGDDGYDRTNKVLTLQQDQWVEHYPPMNLACSETAVVSTDDGKYIFVVGGGSFSLTTNTVELFHVKTKKWYELKSLPQPLYRPSVTICDNQLHIIGGNGNGYSCSLQSLQSSDQPMTSQNFNIMWTLLPQLPVKWSTAASLCGQLITIGGSEVNSIHQLVNEEWVKIGSLLNGRGLCLAVNSSPDKVIIVGGDGGGYLPLNSVEECVVV